MAIVQWCNDNSGFVSAVLSLITIFISVLAIIISLRTARLPFKKRIKLSGSFDYVNEVGTEFSKTIGIYVNACNVGNRAVNIKYLGLAVSKKPQNDYSLIRNLRGGNTSDDPIMPTEIFRIKYSVYDGFIDQLQQYDKNSILYLYLEDTE